MNVNVTLEHFDGWPIKLSHGAHFANAATTNRSDRGFTSQQFTGHEYVRFVDLIEIKKTAQQPTSPLDQNVGHFSTAKFNKQLLQPPCGIRFPPLPDLATGSHQIQTAASLCPGPDGD